MRETAGMPRKTCFTGFACMTADFYRMFKTDWW
jgi:hypothetical protein